MYNSFELEKKKFDEKYNDIKEIDCIVPVHLSYNKKEKNLFKKDGTHNEQYYKWQYIYSLVNSDLCTKDYIGCEIEFPKGNKSSAPIKIDAVIFDDRDWFCHYEKLHTIKDDSKWDELNWLKKHMVCAIEFKKENSKDVKGVFNSQLKSYMSESAKSTMFGVLYDCGRLYLFIEQKKQYLRLSDEFNVDNKGKLEITFDNPDPYVNILSFNDMIGYEFKDKQITDYSKRSLSDLSIIAKNDSKKLNDALYQILFIMDKCGLVTQKGYNILIQILALKIYDEKNNNGDL